jgi:hypothetical protein
LNFAAVGNSGGGGDAAVRGVLPQLLHARLPDPAAVRAEIRRIAGRSAPWPQTAKR